MSMQGFDEKKANHTAGFNKINRLPVIDGTGSPASTITTQIFTISANSGIEKELFISTGNTFKPRVSGRTAVVDRKSDTVQWEKSSPSLSGYVYDNRCLQKGLESFLSGSEDRGSLVSKGKRTGYTNSGIESSKTCHFSIHIQMENTSALSYLVKMGGTQNQVMLDLSKEIWAYLIKHKITITVEYLPSKLNFIADWESRNVRDQSGWKLSPKIFQMICQKWGTPDMDLFASRISHQVQAYMAWKPDPGSRATDALQQSWKYLFPYAFPPFSLIGRVLAKVRKRKNTINSGHTTVASSTMVCNIELSLDSLPLKNVEAEIESLKKKEEKRAPGSS